MFIRPHLEYAIQASHPMPRRKGTGKCAEACSEVRERASACPVRSSPQTASSIIPHTPANSWRPNSHMQDYPLLIGNNQEKDPICLLATLKDATKPQ